jgi:hypothetical protein
LAILTFFYYNVIHHLTAILKLVSTSLVKAKNCRNKNSFALQLLSLGTICMCASNYFNPKKNYFSDKKIHPEDRTKNKNNKTALEIIGVKQFVIL